MSYTILNPRWSPNKYNNCNPSSGFIVHHMATTNFDAAADRFSQPTEMASAHYCVGPGYVQQCVSLKDGAWAAGDYWANTSTIQFECVNATGDPEWAVDERTVDTLCELMADICKERGWYPLERKKNVWGHRDFQATFCPGVLYDRIDEICTRVNTIIEKGVDDMVPEDLMYANISTEASGNIPVWQAWSWTYTYAKRAAVELPALTEAVKTLTKMNGGDPEEIANIVRDAVDKKLESLELVIK